MGLSIAEWILAGVGVLGAIVGTVIWLFATFETKQEAIEASEVIHDQHEKLEERLTRQEGLLQRVAQDASFIRGLLEGSKGRAQ